MKKIVVLTTITLLGILPNFAQEQKIKVQFELFDSDSNTIQEFISGKAVGSDNTPYNFEGDFLQLKKGRYNFILHAETYYSLSFEANIYRDTVINLYLEKEVQEFEGTTVRAIKVKEKSGFAHTNMSRAEISRVNLGQDFTYIIGNTASAVTTSDAGTGVGYTGVRIRGSDATRINVTVNGIPINDAESHGVYWVNMPDLASSTANVQIQRGVGSSTIGTGSFGANINIQNTNNNVLPSVLLSQSFGSFNTSKSTLMFNSGNLGMFKFSGRLSRITSDGYIDRAASDLQAFQFNLKYTTKKLIVDAISFGGMEKTYQSWYGTPQSRLDGNADSMNAYADRNYLTDAQRANLLNSGRTYNYYTYHNQTDNYWQNHYQLHINYSFNKYFTYRSAFFTTTGKGYFEEYRENANFANYRVDDYIVGTDTISSTNLVRQRWLDNIFYGYFGVFNYKREKDDINIGFNISDYQGKHFGKVIWAEIAQPFGLDKEYYNSKSQKSEINTFAKWTRGWSKKIETTVEAQFRSINYWSKGNDNDGTAIDFDVNYQFFNPKLAAVYLINKQSNIYASYSIGSREPIRSDFIDNAVNEFPKPEFLGDLEFGYILRNNNKYLQVNIYNMDYKDQLVVTGELNDVGNALRKNVGSSYRRGLELIVKYPIIKKLSLDANATFSSNKIKNFKDYYYDYSSGGYIIKDYELTDIAFSPNLIAFFGITDRHLMGFELSANVKYVGKQYLDNTLNNSTKLDPYALINFQFQKEFKVGQKSKLVLKGMINNLTGIFYSNNGYTYKYVYSGNLTRENFYYPQSGRNFMIGVDFNIF